ncbi:class I SAM-dependent methyltransferase [Algoriphagus sp. D3-2-R+10]|uniref:class I SAM-dependent methyltransferase n=1 Tax=Algoriphagus aurantiacus TaxID=3103948 RepID=UPI002B3BEDCA|nr:class I SAM-dependent methyltransferase [Algoriphagus sp. D3-2-R+10]MEB2778320.1 class I SAM-dependent methyltransferase [Algoriphagus sp. D3-2-R+10]
MKNPINKDYTLKVEGSYNVEEIINQYKSQFNLDVSEYFQDIENIKIYKCQKTKYRFYFPFTIVGDGVFYELLSNSKNNYYHSRWEHKEALKYAVKPDKWLEIGSGNSYFLKQLANKDVECTGLELNQVEVDNARAIGLNVVNKDFFTSINELGKFNVIALFQVLEHMWDISLFFKKASDLLEPNGKIIFSVPNSNPYLYVFDKFHTLNLPPHHMGLWNKESVRLVGKEFGFKLIDCQTERLSDYELIYLFENSRVSDLLKLNLKYGILKIVYALFPLKLRPRIATLFRNRFLEGRNLFVVLEKI